MSPSPLSEITPVFFEACDMAMDLVGSEAVTVSWELPSAVDGFSVGALAAHLYSAIRLLEFALEKPEPSSARVSDVAEFYSLNRVEDRSGLQDTFHVDIRADAAKRSERGPKALAEQFEALVGRLRGVLAEQPMTRLVPVWRIEGGATQLSDYLLTRIVELVVHADDMAASVDMTTELPHDASSAVFAVFVELARARFGDIAVLRAFARRERGDAEVLRVL